MRAGIASRALPVSRIQKFEFWTEMKFLEGLDTDVVYCKTQRVQESMKLDHMNILKT